MSWKNKLFSGGEDVDEVRINYDTRYYLMLCAFLALHGIIIFVGLLLKNNNSALFLLTLLLIIVQVGGVVRLLD